MFCTEGSFGYSSGAVQIRVGLELAEQNRVRITSSTVLGTPPNGAWTKTFPSEELRGGCFVRWVFYWESTGNWGFHHLNSTRKRTRTPPEMFLSGQVRCLCAPCRSSSVDFSWLFAGNSGQQTWWEFCGRILGPHTHTHTHIYTHTDTLVQTFQKL